MQPLIADIHYNKFQSVCRQKIAGIQLFLNEILLTYVIQQ